ncbi:farnesyl-diphosphate synthase [Desulfoluna limicola]|uniref:Farnesyl-diphosphate synthase n=1 Tax=Desulfoluna limicola TaxID=2810562 RepID=A0ABM7PER1_9BACT|nr:farnesyl diphosphate synthase [Desulfoluna limicola]BCS95776.1 farnesyl-diphosphate synthase [Desulfoluna limicola]
MSAFNLKGYLEERRLIVERSLKEHLGASTPPVQGRVGKAMEYSLMAGGKRLRPVLCMAACESVGGDSGTALKTASALEMIHTYSLIHDDLPAMDNDDLRRGRPTCHKAFDEATAILAGDALVTSAFHLLAMDRTLPGEVALEVIRIIAEASGAFGMIEGQMRDIEAEGTPLDLEALKELHGLKTGALIRASVEAGAVMGGATSGERDALKRYADKIGLAFQVTDDILNVEGDPQLMGKGVGTDAQLNKATYPALMGLADSKAYATSLVEEAVFALSEFETRAEPLKALALYIVQRQR